MNVNITVADVFRIFIVAINRNDVLNVNGSRTDVALHGEILTERDVSLGHVHLARIQEVTGSSRVHLEALAGIESEVGNEFILHFVIPTSRRIVIVLILAVICVACLKSSQRALELDIDFAITDILALAIDGDEFGKFQTAATDCIEGADLLRQELTHCLILVADHVGRFDTEAYCGAECRRGCNHEFLHCLVPLFSSTTRCAGVDRCSTKVEGGRRYASASDTQTACFMALFAVLFHRFRRSVTVWHTTVHPAPAGNLICLTARNISNLLFERKGEFQKK